MDNALVLVSGGVDSSTCLALAVEKYGHDHVKGLCLYYGQRHVKEMESAHKICDYYQVPLYECDLSRIFTYSSCNLLAHNEDTIPHRAYSEQVAESEGPVSTYVPFRNGLFLSTAASFALSLNCQVIYYGAHADDAAGNAYPDCSSVFNDAMNQAIVEGSGHQVRIEAPFVGVNKAEVVRQGLALKVPYELTWSCYEGGDTPCGVCGICRDRALAFEKNGVTDPLLVKE